MIWVRVKPRHVGKWHLPARNGIETLCNLTIPAKAEYVDHLTGSACQECRDELRRGRLEAQEHNGDGLLPQFTPRPYDAERIGLMRLKLLCGRTLASMECVYGQCIETVVPPHARSGKSAIESKYVPALLTELAKFVILDANRGGGYGEKA